MFIKSWLPLVAAVSCAAGRLGFAETESLASYVNPFIGTGPNAVVKVGWAFDTGNVFPGAVCPQGMLAWSPDTTNANHIAGGYWYPDSIIDDFSLTHFSGRGVVCLKEIGFMPVAKEVTLSPGTNWETYAATYSHQNESATPGYYQVKFDNGIVTKLTASPRTGMAQFSFPPGSPTTLLIRTVNSISAAGTEVSGYKTAHSYKVYFVAQFDQPFQSVKTWMGDAIGADTTASGDACGAILEFSPAQRDVQVRVGISYVSIDNARANLAAENAGKDFAALKAGAEKAWNDKLSRIEVEGGTSDEKHVFYTALYHCFMHPNILEDVNGQYPGMDGKVHSVVAGHHQYQNIPAWDEHRSHTALMALLESDVSSDVMQSLVNYAQQDASVHPMGGGLPRWEQINFNSGGMVGDGPDSMIATAYAFGARDFDVKSAYSAMDKGASVPDTTSDGHKIREGLKEYQTLGYVPEKAAVTQEYCSDDFSLSEFARAMGDEKKAAAYRQRAQNWKNLFDPSVGYIRPRAADGSWIAGFDPKKAKGFVEGSASQYLWLENFNFKALIDKLGGNAKAVERLDAFFQKTNAGISSEQAYMGNEPCEETPWVYDFASAPSRTQDVVRRIQTELFTNQPDGFPGNDDAGSISSWYVFSALGIYPVIPGVAGFVVGSPVFTKATLHRKDGTNIEIIGKSASVDAPYIQSLKINGQSYESPWIPWSLLSKGGTLDFDWAINPPSGEIPPTKRRLPTTQCNYPGHSANLAPYFMVLPVLKVIAITSVCLSLGFSLDCSRALGDPPGAPNEIFPAEPAAAGAVNWKDGYFYINGQPTLISSGSIHYSRVPRELWRDRIWRLQQMGFNCVQSYVFWNASEPKEGQWGFTDNVDLDAWLSLLKEMNMYALVRVGPYSCAEWEQGGYPAWLTVKPDMTEREMGPSVPYSDAFLGKVEAITAKHQVNHGGSVFLVQLENEHSRGWGTSVDDPYLKYLDDQARANGIEVPMFNSGLHHSAEPTGEVPFPADPSPWYSTEFWTGWIGKYGEMPPGTYSEKTRGSWKAIAFGGAGYNYYMALGGTNFGYSGDSLPASYDYSAPIGEAGQLRGFYFLARRAASFARAFTPLLTGSHNDPDFANCDQPDLRVTTRTNPTGGSIIFIDHFMRKASAAPVAAIVPEASAYHAPKADPDVVLETHVSVGNMTLPHQGSLKVAVLEPRTIIVNFPWTKNASFESICTNVLFRKNLGGVDYWVCYGTAGDAGEVTLTRQTAGKTPAQFDFTYPAGDTVQEIDVDSGDGQQAKFLVMNTEMTNRTWFAHDKLYVGPSFVLEDGSIEFPPAGGKATIYSASGKSEVTQPAATTPDLPALSSWTWRDAAAARAPGFDASKWLSSTGPQPMETYDSFQNRYGWYRTVFHRDADGPVSLHLGEQSGTFAAFLNGQAIDPVTFPYGGSATLDFPAAKAGDNTLAILVKASPRAKGPSYGPVGKRNARGIWGGVSFDKTATPVQVSWKKGNNIDRNAEPADLGKPEYDDTAWPAFDPSSSPNPIQMSRGSTWFRGTFNLTTDQTDAMIDVPVFASSHKDGRGNLPAAAKTICYLNGHIIDEHVQDVSKILVAGKNTVLLEIQSRLGEDSGNLSLGLWHNAPLTAATWNFQGGLDGLDETAIIGLVTNWDSFLAKQPWQTDNVPANGAPTLWKCTFTYQHPAGMRESIGLITDGLKAGHVWLNGHNLGECPQTVLMYMPECWLKDGKNDLVIFDLYGAHPDKVQLSRYESFAVAPPK